MLKQTKRICLILTALLLAPIVAECAGPDTLRLCFVGDVMAHNRQLDVARSVRAGRNRSSAYNFESYFKYVEPHFRECDINVANMEFPCGVRPYTGYPVFATPESLPQQAIDSGIDLFLVANNHICDKGRAGLDSTFAVYSRLPVRFTGLYQSREQEEADNPMILSSHGIKVAFVNFTYGLNGFRTTGGYVVPQMDTTHVKAVIERARERGADYIVVLPHWGEEYQLDCSSQQRRWARNLYRWGADMIVGSHPHVPQAVEYDGQHITAYSLGNFISNMSVPYSQIGIMLTATIIRGADGSISTEQPQVTYLWCGRGGFMEENYTTVPVEDYINRPTAFMERSQYEKMVTEYRYIINKFSRFEQDHNTPGN